MIREDGGIEFQITAEKVIGSLNPFVTEISISEIVSPALIKITVIYFSCLEMGKWLETN